MCALNITNDKCNMIYLKTKFWILIKGTSYLISFRRPVDNDNTELEGYFTVCIMVVTYGEPKKGYLNFTFGNLWATQPIAQLI